MLAFVPSAGAATTGTLQITVVAPRGVPATVVAAGKQLLVVAKAPAVASQRKRLAATPGRYDIQARPLVHAGRFYAATVARPRVRVQAGRLVTVRVVYRLVPSARDLQPSAIDTTRLGLRWQGPKGARYELRRVKGPDAPTRRSGGVRVKVTGTSALDTGLRSGAQYSYALFTRLGQRWTGPLTLTAGTAPAVGSNVAAYISAPGTLLAEPTDVVSAAPTGSGVALRLSGTQLPAIGDVIALQPSAGLPGGYLGRVIAVAADGTITLTAAGLDEAFDYYHLDIPAFQDAEAPLEPAPAAPAAGRRAPRAVPCGLGGSVSGAIVLRPSFGLGGHFTATIDKKNIFGVKIPKGASMSMSLYGMATLPIDVNVSVAIKCGLPFKPLMRQLTVTPVPLAFYFTPVAEVSVTGSGSKQNIGVWAKAGFQFSGSIGLGSANLDGGPIREAGALQSSGSGEVKVGATLGGEVIVGPGAGTGDAGVIAGVGGKLNVIDVSAGGVFPDGDKRNACLKIDGASTLELNVTAKAWVGSWDVSKSLTFGFLQGRLQWPGTPWYWPGDCTKLPPDEPTKPTDPEPTKPGDTVVGDGVTVIEDTVIGAPEQGGHLDGFVPGQKTWVLSTGNIANAVGTPGTFASTKIGTPGDDALSAIVGRQTFDAAGYELRLVPEHDTLHVRYVFASEEYPEYAGTSFNDVMRVTVDGETCSHVPGSQDPVSVNSINHFTNAQWYVAGGASGYATTMDGLTLPLDCEVPVTPGQQVTVRIVVADTSDQIYDSAVALVDDGIWSD